MFWALECVGEVFRAFECVGEVFRAFQCVGKMFGAFECVGKVSVKTVVRHIRIILFTRRLCLTRKSHCNHE